MTAAVRLVCAHPVAGWVIDIARRAGVAVQRDVVPRVAVRTVGGAPVVPTIAITPTMHVARHIGIRVVAAVQRVGTRSVAVGVVFIAIGARIAVQRGVVVDGAGAAVGLRVVIPTEALAIWNCASNGKRAIEAVGVDADAGTVGIACVTRSACSTISVGVH